MNRHHVLTCAGLLLLYGSVVQVPAATILVDTNDSSPVVITENTGEAVTDEEGKIQTWTGTFNASTFDLTWDLTIDPDPLVFGALSLTNVTNVTNTYQIDVTFNSLVDISAPGIMNGSSTIGILATNGNQVTGAMSAPETGDQAIYSGLINGVTQRTLFPGPPPGPIISDVPPVYTLTAQPGRSNFDTGNFSSEPTITSLGEGEALTLRQHFRLTPGDTASLLSSFEVVPSPTGSVLLWLGALGLGCCRRKRTPR